MTLRVLLVNPNTMKMPPVIPIGLEYLITALKKYEYNVELLDLCFASSPENELNKTLDQKKYDIVGVTVRNIDFGLYFNSEFYLPAIKIIVQCIKKHDIPVVLGGAGFSAMPDDILEYLGADYGIIGPGERAFPEFLKSWESKTLEKRIHDGWQFGPDVSLVHFRGEAVNYMQYMSENGIIGFQTHVGCNNQCPYCIEANRKLWLKNIPNIIEEIRHLVDQGHSHFHLCDSEFNNDLNYSLDFCKALKESQLPLKWTLYMKPTPYSEELFKVLKESNAYLITLTVDSDERIQALNNYSYEDLVKIIEYCDEYKINIAIDLLTGYPHESLESTNKMLDFFRAHRPTRVSVGFYYRLAKGTPLTELIKKEVSLREKLTRSFSKGENFLKPIFFHQYSPEYFQELIAEENLFSIAGVVPGVNYQQEEDNKTK